MFIIPRLMGIFLSFGLTSIPFIITLPFTPDLRGSEQIEEIKPTPKRRQCPVGYDVKVTRYSNEFHLGQEPVEF
jgi:hypothetical protein